MKTAQQLFCEGLKSERERRGITLASITASTKVKEILLAGLEENDFSRWPQGNVYRRAFVRHYVAALGLPVQSTLAEFDRLFPDDSASTLFFDAGAPNDPSDGARLALATEPPPALPGMSARILAASSDVGVVLLVASVSTQLVPVNIWTGISMVALGYYTLGTLFFGGSVALWWLTNRAAGDGVLRLRKPAMSSESTSTSDLQPSMAAETWDDRWSPVTAGSGTGAGPSREGEWAGHTRAWVGRGSTTLWRAGVAVWAFPVHLGAAATSAFRRDQSRGSVRRGVHAYWERTLSWLRSTTVRLKVSRRRSTNTMATVLSTVSKSVAAISTASRRRLSRAKSLVRSASDVQHNSGSRIRKSRKPLLTFSVAATAVTLVIFLYASGGSNLTQRRSTTTVAPASAPAQAPSRETPAASASPTDNTAPFAADPRTSFEDRGESGEPNRLKTVPKTAAVRTARRRSLRRSVARRRSIVPAQAAQPASDALPQTADVAQPAADIPQPAADAAQPVAETPQPQPADTPVESPPAAVAPPLPIDEAASSNVVETSTVPPDNSTSLNGNATEPSREVKPEPKKAPRPAGRGVRRGKPAPPRRAPR